MEKEREMEKEEEMEKEQYFWVTCGAGGVGRRGMGFINRLTD